MKRSSRTCSEPASVFFPSPRPARTRPGQRLATLVIDAEEDFDWLSPLPDTWHSTECMRHIGQLHQILAAYGIAPAYLVTYPVLEDEGAVSLLRAQHERSRCVLGIQLHTWVTPPYDETASAAPASFSGNLPPGLEERKLLSLHTRFRERFGQPPVVFRSGRYGLGTETACLLEQHGFTIDTSLAPRTSFRSEGGPDYRGIDDRPFWFGTGRALLEMPLSRDVVGWSGNLAPRAYDALARHVDPNSAILSLLTRSRMAERITLSPEGNDIRAMRRLIDRSVARGQTLLSLSFHSSSLHPGRNPYVRTRADLHHFYDRLSAVLSYVTDTAGFRFVEIDRIPELIEPPDSAAP